MPVIGGAMYPCSNPELVAAVSEAGGIGIIQPLSLTYVHRYGFREGLQYIKSLTKKPIGLNVIVEKSSKKYREKMEDWVSLSLEEGVRFFVTSLGNPAWVVDRVQSAGGLVYHDVTDAKWAEKGLKAGATGLICVNNRAGGHAGGLSAQTLYKDLKSFQVPLICAGGIGNEEDFKEVIDLGYSGVQMGTRFIATTECSAHEDYKKAILKASEKDIALTERISGVPVSVIRTPFIEKMGTQANWLQKRLLKHSKTKHWMRLAFTLKSLWELPRANLKGSQYKDYWQAGKSVETIQAVEPVAAILKRFQKILD